MLAGVELGGTKCICILGTGPDDICARAEVPTGEPAATLATIAAVLADWSFAALGIASFGPLDLDPASPHFGSIVNTTKPKWSGTALLGLAGDIPVAIDTDVNGAALAEGRWGAARDLASWAYITVGTGVGVGSIGGGRPLRGLGHSEAGHQRIARRPGDDFAGICSFHGDCVEGLASGPAIAARTGRPGREIAADDAVWEMSAHAIAMLCHNLVLTSLPERILIGGGVPLGQPQWLPLVRRHLAASLAGYANSGAVVDCIESFVQPPGLGADAGPLGALALAGAALDARQSMMRST